jgi:hypothetical protein
MEGRNNVPWVICRLLLEVYLRLLVGEVSWLNRRNSLSRSLSKWYSFATVIRFARALHAMHAATAPTIGPTQ